MTVHTPSVIWHIQDVHALLVGRPAQRPAHTCFQGFKFEFDLHVTILPTACQQSGTRHGLEMV